MMFCTPPRRARRFAPPYGVLQASDLGKSQLLFPTCFLTQGGPGSVRCGYGLGRERFKRFRFSVLAVPLQKRFFCVSVQFNRKERFRFRLRFLENALALQSLFLSQDFEGSAEKEILVFIG